LNASTRIAADAEAFEDDRLDIQALEEREQIPARLRDEPIREEVPIADDDRQSRFSPSPRHSFTSEHAEVVGVLRRDQLTINRLSFRLAGRSTGDVPVRLIDRGAP
jgi:hypothetical protein